MTPEELNLELKALVGKTVYERIMGASLIIYFFEGVVDEGVSYVDESVAHVFFFPAWRYQQSGRVVVGSADFDLYVKDFNSRAEHDAAFERACALLDSLNGARLEDYELDLETFDICMKFSDGKVVRNYLVTSDVDTTAWTYENRARKVDLVVTAAGIELNTE